MKRTCALCNRRPPRARNAYCSFCISERRRQHLDRLAVMPPPPNYALLEHAPAPTVTVAEANKRKPSEMATAKVGLRARPRAYARLNTRAGSRGSMSG